MSELNGLTLDAGALIALERGNRLVATTVRKALAQQVGIRVPAAVVAQVWRDGARQAVLARTLTSDGVTIVPLDEPRAKAAGRLCGWRGTRDVVDASVVLCAMVNDDTVMTSDPDDLLKLEPSLNLVVV